MLIILIIYFIFTQKGFINTLLESVSIILSLGVSYKLYKFIGSFLVANFTLQKGIANAAGFFIGWFLAEIIFSVILLTFFARLFRKYQRHPINMYLGVVAAIIEAAAIYLFFVSFIFAFPVRGQIKQALLDSRTGPYFVEASRSLEKHLKNVFGEAVNETLNFLTVKPESEEKVNLGFHAQANLLTNDAASEKIMFDSVNNERKKAGVQPLIFDDKLRDLARSYAEVMLGYGFFSHVSAVDGSTPAERANRFGISYSVIGENLAYAPDVYVAHDGLMHSEGHRKNILYTDFGKVGIGVVDAGIYGKMFVQEFTN